MAIGTDQPCTPLPKAHVAPSARAVSRPLEIDIEFIPGVCRPAKGVYRRTGGGVAITEILSLPDLQCAKLFVVDKWIPWSFELCDAYAPVEQLTWHTYKLLPEGLVCVFRLVLIDDLQANESVACC
jgi:hypothetical protein